jgi:hypothetical protein
MSFYLLFTNLVNNSHLADTFSTKVHTKENRVDWTAERKCDEKEIEKVWKINTMNYKNQYFSVFTYIY